MKIIPKILWLSDIHYKVQSDFVIVTKKDYNNYFELLYNDIANNYADLTHLIITGDIAFSAKPEEYADFYKFFLQKIIKKYPNVAVITLCGNHDTDQTEIYNLIDNKKSEKKNIDALKKALEKREKDSMNFFNGDYDDFKNFKINTNHDIVKYSEQYRKFFLNNIRTNLNNHNDRIDFVTYDNSEGLTGIIYDKLYNLIFIALNSSWYCLGDGNILELFKNGSNSNLQSFIYNYEYSHLEIGNIKHLIKQLEDLNNKSILEECFVITAIHHPLPYLSWKLNYEQNSDLNVILKNTNVLLQSHLHTYQDNPSIQNQRFYIFDSPQICDYHILTDDDIDKSNNNLGYNVLYIDNEIPKITKNLHKFKVYKNGLKIDLEFQKEKETNSYDYLLKEKFILRKNVVDSLGDIQEVNTYIQKRILNNDNASVYNIDTIKQLITKFKTKKNLNFTDKTIEGLKIYYLVEGNKMSVFPVINSSDTDPIDQLKNKINFSFINQLIKLNKGANYIVVLFFDFYIMDLYIKSNHQNINYTNTIDYFENVFRLLKHDIFSNEEHSKIENCSLCYEIINLESYNN